MPSPWAVESARDMDQTGARQVHEAVSDAGWPHLGSDSRKPKSHGSLVSNNRFTPLVREQYEETLSALENGDDIDCQLLIQPDPSFPARRVSTTLTEGWVDRRWLSSGRSQTEEACRARQVKRKIRRDETRPERKQTSSMMDMS